MGSLERRLEVLEDRVPAKQPESSDRSEVRAHMKAHLDRIAALRRSGDPEDQAELEAVRSGVERRLEEHRG